jgi:hypothetical protein
MRYLWTHAIDGTTNLIEWDGVSELPTEPGDILVPEPPFVEPVLERPALATEPQEAPNVIE